MTKQHRQAPRSSCATGASAEGPGEISRRQFALATSAAAFGAAIGLPTFSALPKGAFAAETKSVNVGSDFEVFSVSDGFLTLPITFLAPDAPAEERTAALQQAGQTGETYKSPINVTAIRTPTDLILVDVGSGAHFMSTAGKLAETLGSQGLERDAVTKVIFTHAHPDHIWGTVDDFDELLFPNAAYYMSAAERDFWMSDDILSKLPEDRQSFGVGAQRNIKVIEDRTTMVAPGDTVAPGITIMDTKGHTPGHISVSLTSGKDRLVVLGDALTHPVISFKHPEWKTGSDHIPELGIETRLRLLAELAAEETRIIGYHLPSGGLGRVARSGDVYAFEPA